MVNDNKIKRKIGYCDIKIYTTKGTCQISGREAKQGNVYFVYTKIPVTLCGGTNIMIAYHYLISLLCF